MSSAALVLSLALNCCAQTTSDAAEVRQALIAFDRWLGGSPHAAAWHGYLHTDSIRQQLAQATAPQADVLAEVLKQFSADQAALNAAPAVRLRLSLEQWLTTVSLPAGAHLATVCDSLVQRFQSGPHPATDGRSSAKHGLTREEFESELDKVVSDLREYAIRPSPVLARQAGEALDRLAATRQADPFVTAVRRYYRYPNVWIVVSEEMLSRRAERPIDRATDVRQTILGTRITGSGLVHGKADLELISGKENAELKTTVTGTARTRTVGRNGPAIIHSTAVTTFRSEKKIVLGEKGLQSLPAVTRARTTTNVYDIDSTLPRLRGRIVERIASRRVADAQSQAEAIAARFAEQRVNAAVDREAHRMINRLNEVAIAPLMDIGGAGTTTQEDLWFRSVPGYLLIGRRGPLGAATLPAGNFGGSEISLSFPAGMLSYFAADTLGKTTLGESRIAKALNRALGFNALALGKENEKDNWSMTFASDRPFGMELLPEGLALTLRGSGFSTGDKIYQGLDITGKYRWVNTPKGYRFVRNEPFSFQTSTLESTTEKAGVADTVLTGLLEKGMESLMPAELSLFTGLKLGSGDQSIELGEVVRFDVHQDWVTLGYNPPKDDDAARQATRQAVIKERGAALPWRTLRVE